MDGDPLMVDQAQAHDTRALEALFFVSDEPIAASVLAQALDVDRRTAESLCDRLAADLEARGSGLVLRNIAGGWRLYTHPDTAPVVEQFVLSSRQARLTKAALETLAVVAYKQPVTRHQVSGVRGVNSDGVLRALADRGLVEEVGRDEAPGRPVLFATTPEFLERLGLPSLASLPSLAPLLGVDEAPWKRRRSPTESSTRPRTSAGWRRGGVHRAASRVAARDRPQADTDSRPNGRGTGPTRPRARRVRLAESLRGTDREGPRHRRGDGSRRSATRSTPRVHEVQVDGVTVNLDPDVRYFALQQAARRHHDHARPSGPTGPSAVPSRRRAARLPGRAASIATRRVCSSSRTTATLANRLMHPSFGIEKEYLAEVEGAPTAKHLTRLRAGVELDDGPARAASARIVDVSRGRGSIRLVMTEGRKREVRRMLAEVGLPVVRLVRLRVGPVTLGRPAARHAPASWPTRRSSPCAPPRPGSLGDRATARHRQGVSQMQVRAARGAIVVAEDSPASVLDATTRLLSELLRRNAVETEQLISILFTATATSARRSRRRQRAGWAWASCR